MTVHVLEFRRGDGRERGADKKITGWVPRQRGTCPATGLNRGSQILIFSNVHIMLILSFSLKDNILIQNTLQ